MKTKFDDVTNKCTDCDNCYVDMNKTHCCLLYPNRANAYGCDDELLGNNAEELIEYPDEPDDFHSSVKCHEWQIGEREL